MIHAATVASVSMQMTPTVLIPSSYLIIQIFTGDELIEHSDKKCSIFNEKYPR